GLDAAFDATVLARLVVLELLGERTEDVVELVLDVATIGLVAAQRRSSPMPWQPHAFRDDAIQRQHDHVVLIVEVVALTQETAPDRGYQLIPTVGDRGAQLAVGNDVVRLVPVRIVAADPEVVVPHVPPG